MYWNYMVLYRPIRHPQLSFLGVISYNYSYNPYPFRHKNLHVFMGSGVQRTILYSTFFLRGLSFDHPSLSLKWMVFWGGDFMCKKKHRDFTSVWAATGTPSGASEKPCNGRAYGRGARGSPNGSWLVQGGWGWFQGVNSKYPCSGD